MRICFKVLRERSKSMLCRLQNDFRVHMRELKLSHGHPRDHFRTFFSPHPLCPFFCSFSCSCCSSCCCFCASCSCSSRSSRSSRSLRSLTSLPILSWNNISCDFHHCTRRVLFLAGVAVAQAFSPAVVSTGGLTSLRMAQGPPPSTGKPLPKAKIEALEVNKKQWGIEGGAAAPAAAAPPAPKKAAAKKAAAPAGDTTGFSGVPSQFARPESGVYPAEPTEQTFLGMRGPRAPGHRENFGGKHTATMLAIAALLWQPVSEAGMYRMGADGALTKSSFSNMEVPGFGNMKKAPTIESLFPFAKNGFDASPALFGKGSMIVVEDPRDGCGAYANSGACHTFLDEIGDALKKTPESLPRSEAKATYSFPWMYEHAAWKK